MRKLRALIGFVGVFGCLISCGDDDGAPAPSVELICPTVEQMVLGADGTLPLTDFTGNVELGEATLSLDPSEIELVQSPAPETTLTEGVTAITITAYVGDTAVGECSYDVTLVDHTPPTIEIGGVEQGGRVVQPSGGFTPTVTVTDALDANPVVTATLDGTPYAIGTPIEVYGHHVLRVEAEDQAGNRSAVRHGFELARRPMVNGVLVTSSFDCMEDGNGLASFDAQVVLAASEFDADDVLLSTLNLWLLDDAGRTLNRKVVRLAGSTDPDDGSYRNDLVEAYYEAGYWQLQFRATLADAAVEGCPTQLLLTGGGAYGLATAFDFRAVTSAYVVSQPLALLIAMDITNGDPFHVAPPETRSCEWKAEVNPVGAPRQDYDYAQSFGPFGGERMVLRSLEGMFFGEGVVWKVIYPGLYELASYLWRDMSQVASVQSTGSIRIWLEGPEVCDRERATMDCVIAPTFRIRAEIDTPALSEAYGFMLVRSDRCGNPDPAKGGMKLGANEPETIKINAGASYGKDGVGVEAGFEFEMRLSHHDIDGDTYTGGDPLPQTVPTAMMRFGFHSQAKQRIIANHRPWNRYGYAAIAIDDSALGIHVEATSPFASAIFSY